MRCYFRTEEGQSFTFFFCMEEVRSGFLFVCLIFFVVVSTFALNFSQQVPEPTTLHRDSETVPIELVQLLQTGWGPQKLGF